LLGKLLNHRLLLLQHGLLGGKSRSLDVLALPIATPHQPVWDHEDPEQSEYNHVPARDECPCEQHRDHSERPSEDREHRAAFGGLACPCNKTASTANVTQRC
jgi:hypothetical protein